MSWMIVFSCPKTRHDVKSGILTDEHTFAGMPLQKIKMRCQECGETHEWFIGQGHLSITDTDVRWPVPARVA